LVGYAFEALRPNIDDGILLATTKLSNMTIHDGYVSVDPWLRWGTVYDYLDPHELVVLGGRDGSVGVGGLVLGGGISQFTPKRGFACDNVKSFQV
jgi:FAD/FMN-containing dehydrogenase